MRCILYYRKLLLFTPIKWYILFDKIQNISTVVNSKRNFGEFFYNIKKACKKWKSILQYYKYFIKNQTKIKYYVIIMAKIKEEAMADNLIIVESPAKANTIKKFLGGSTKVIASMGHIRDLPKSKLGVNIENDFEPEYINIRGKGDLIKTLKKEAKKAKKIYLATDPDREGEAIAWHLSNILQEENAKITRVTFNEITKTAVKNAIKQPRDIDVNLVDAQQARRVIDRIVGYKMSPVL